MIEGTPEGTVIELDDALAVHEMPVESVLLCRVNEVFQSKPLSDSAGISVWFALGYANKVWTADAVAAWGPLLVLFNPSQDHPSLAVL